MFSLLFSTFTKCPAKIKENVQQKGERLAKAFPTFLHFEGVGRIARLATPPNCVAGDEKSSDLFIFVSILSGSKKGGCNIVYFNTVNRPFCVFHS